MPASPTVFRLTRSLICINSTEIQEDHTSPPAQYRMKSKRISTTLYCSRYTPRLFGMSQFDYLIIIWQSSGVRSLIQEQISIFYLEYTSHQNFTHLLIFQRHISTRNLIYFSLELPKCLSAKQISWPSIDNTLQSLMDKEESLIPFGLGQTASWRLATILFKYSFRYLNLPGI